MRSRLRVLALVLLCPAVWAQAQETAQTPPAKSQDTHPPAKRIKLGGNMAKNMLVHKVQPTYPKAARDARVQGTVRLHAVIGTDGSVHQLVVISGDSLLVESALEAVRHWKYRVTKLNGEPVEVDTTIDIVFSLRG